MIKHIILSSILGIFIGALVILLPKFINNQNFWYYLINVMLIDGIVLINRILAKMEMEIKANE